MAQPSFWKFETLDDGQVKAQLDVEAFVADVTQKMSNLEEEITRDLVIAELRKQGYTIIPPLDHG